MKTIESQFKNKQKVRSKCGVYVGKIIEVRTQPSILEKVGQIDAVVFQPKIIIKLQNTAFKGETMTFEEHELELVEITA